MIVVIRLKTLIIAFLIILMIMLCLGGLIFEKTKHQNSAMYVDNEDIVNMVTEEINNIFRARNNSFLEKNEDKLSNLYNKQIRNGLWAYEHEIKRMKYLHMWAEKQSVEFKNIKSEIKVRNVSEKGQGYALNLLVSTEYKYSYADEPNEINFFRIGTYHSLDLMPTEEGWFITREWYTDPFADSLNLDSMKSEENTNIILTHGAKELSNLNERRINAVDYANRYCGAASLPEYGFAYNSKYRNYNSQGGDCANFASQMLHEGGKFSKNGTWNYTKGAGSRAWVNAHSFNNYMLYSGRASTIARGSYNTVLKSSYELLPGDYVAYIKSGKVTHISVVTGADSKGYALVNSHNTDRYRTPWDLGWSNKGVSFILVRVHY